MPKVDKSQYSLRQVYRFYLKRCKEQGDEPVDYKTHKLILDTWGTKVVQYLIAGKDVKLHNGMASLMVRKKKMPTYIDYKASAIAGKQVVKPNVHSDYYGALVRWNRHYTTVSSRGWRFIPSRALARGVSAVMSKQGGHRIYVKQAKVTPKYHQKSNYKNHILES